MQVTASLADLRSELIDALHDTDIDLASAILATIRVLKAQS